MADDEIPGQYIEEKKDLHDCVFLVGPGKERISSVKSFLANFSMFFRKMLTETDTNERYLKYPIIIPVHGPDVFKLMLSYVYGNHDLKFQSINQAKRFHWLTDQYSMPKLEKVSGKYLKETCKTFIDIVECYVLLGIKDMEEMAVKAVETHAKNLFCSEELFGLKQDIMLFIVQQNVLNVTEVELWEALLKWAKNQCGNVSNTSTAVTAKVSDDEPVYQDPDMSEHDTDSTNEFEVNNLNYNVVLMQLRPFTSLDDPDQDTDIRTKLKNILKHVRFLAMSTKDFAEKVIPTSVLNEREIIDIYTAMATGEDCKIVSLCNQRKHRFGNTVLNLSASFLSCGTNTVVSCKYTISVKNRTLELISLSLIQQQARVNLNVSIRKVNDKVTKTLSTSLSQQNKYQVTEGFKLEPNEKYFLQLSCCSGSSEMKAYQMHNSAYQKDIDCEHCTISMSAVNCYIYSCLEHVEFYVFKVL